MKKLFIVIACLAVVAALLFFFVFRKKHQPAVDQEIAKRLVLLVRDGSNGLYNLEMDSLVADVIDSKLTVYKARLRPDTTVYDSLLLLRKAPPDLFDVQIDQFSIDDISPVDFLAAKEINLEKILLKHPVIRVIHRNVISDTVRDDSSKTVFQRIQDKVSKINVDTIRIEDASFTYDNRSKKKISKIERVNFVASDFLLAEETQNDTSRFLFSKNCSIRVYDYSMVTNDKLYKFTFDNLIIETSRRLLVVNKLAFQPAMGATAFYKAVGHQQDRFDLKIDQVGISDIAWWSVLGEESLVVPRVTLNQLALDIYNDKSQKPDTRSKMGKYPHQMLMKLAFGLKVDTITISNMRFTYNEKNPKTDQVGILYFSDVNGNIFNATNDSLTIKRKPMMQVDLRASFMRETPMHAKFSFNLARERTGDFEVDVNLGKVSAKTINYLSIPLGSLKIDDINMKSLDCNIKGNNASSRGMVRFEYAGLKVAALKNNGDTLKKRKFLSFLANTFILKSENPMKGKAVTVVYPTFTRDPQKSFFNLVWKTIFTGIKMTAGINKKN